MSQRSKKSWTADDSKREMKRWTSVTPPTEPAVQQVQATLNENTKYFMENIAGLVSKFSSCLNTALDSNPKRAEDVGVNRHASSPLLNRPTDMATDPNSTSAQPRLQSFSSGDVTNAPVVVRLVRKKQAAATSEKEKAKNEGPKTSEAGEKHPSAESATAKPPVAKGADGGNAAEDDDDDGDSSDSSDCDPSPDAPAVKIPDNKELLQQLRILKREAYELGTTFDGIHDWIALNVPDLKDDDNTGIEVMDAVMEQVTSLNDAVREVYSIEGKYMEDRSENECTVMKYPDAGSIRLVLEVADRDLWDDIERGWRILIRTSLILYTVLSRNMEKLKNPRQQRSMLSI